MASTWMMVSNGFNMFQHFAIKTGVANSRSMADRIVVLWGASWHDGCGLWPPSWCLVAVGGCGPLGLQKFTVLRQIIPVESHKRWVEISNSLWEFPILHTNAYKCIQMPHSHFGRPTTYLPPRTAYHLEVLHQGWARQSLARTLPRVPRNPQMGRPLRVTSPSLSWSTSFSLSKSRWFFCMSRLVYCGL